MASNPFAGARFRRQIACWAFAFGALAVAPATEAAETAKLVPAPSADPTTASSAAGPRTLVLSGGCFWGVQGVFQHVRGVESAVSGYAGGAAATAHYEMVSSGHTGHAESVQITYDPRVVSAGQLLRVFFSVAHDPTQRDRQGPDTGTQYRSAIFYDDGGQQALAKSYIEELDRSAAFGKSIATRVEPLKGFYPAESYHQDYLVLHPASLYIIINDQPKIDSLKRLFPDLYRAEPKLVGEARSPS